MWLCVADKREKRGPKDLSDETHYDGDENEHNQEYDHDAFLGKEDADTFDKLPPGEAKRRLGYDFFVFVSRQVSCFLPSSFVEFCD